MNVKNFFSFIVGMFVKKQVKQIDIHQAYQLMQSSQPPVLIDVREDHEWQKGHIPQATHLVKDKVLDEIKKTVPNLDTPIILYCSGGYRSAIVAKSLNQLGYHDVSSIKEGCMKWRDAGYPFG